MQNIYKGLSALANACSYAAGIFVAVMMMIKKDYVPVFQVENFDRAESLVLNLLAIEIPLMLLTMVVCAMAKEDKPNSFTVEFPTVYAIAPVVITLINIIFSFGLSDTSSTVFVIIGSVIYLVSAVVTVFFGSKTFQIYSSN